MVAVVVDDGDCVMTMFVGKTDVPILDDAGWKSLTENASAGCVYVGVLGVLKKMVCEASFKCSNAPMQRDGTIEDAAQQKKLVDVHRFHSDITVICVYVVDTIPVCGFGVDLYVSATCRVCS